MRVVSPIGDLAVRESGLASDVPTSLTNVSLLANGWPAMKTMAGIMQERLRDEYGSTVSIFHYETSQQTAPEEIDRAVETADYVIAGAAT